MTKIDCKNHTTCVFIQQEKTKQRETQALLEGTIKSQIEKITHLLGNNNQTLSLELQHLTNTDDLQQTVSHLVSLLVSQVQSNQTIIEESKTLIESLEQENEKLRKDQLTGLYNRHKFDEIYNTLEQDNITFSLAIIDIDKFKTINDTYGHLCGDEVLKFLGKKLVELFGQNYVFRFGGEEFTILYPGSKEKLQRILENFLATMKNTRLDYKKQHKFIVTFTGGVEQFSQGISFEKLFRTADSLLYKGKQNGRCQVVIE